MPDADSTGTQPEYFLISEPWRSWHRRGVNRYDAKGAKKLERLVPPLAFGLKGVSDLFQAQRFESAAFGPAAGGIPSFEFVELCFPLFELGFVDLASGILTSRMTAI